MPKHDSRILQYSIVQYQVVLETGLNERITHVHEMDVL